MGTRLIPVLLFFVCLAGLRPVAGQTMSFRFDQTSVSEAIGIFRIQTGIDVVFSQRLVDGRRTSCRYVGSVPEEGLRCIVASDDIRVDRISSSQFVLIPTRNDAFRKKTGSVTGFLSDQETGESLYGANLFLPEQRAGTTSNEAGYFALTGVPVGARRLRISFIGYQTLDTTLVVDDNPNFITLRPVTFAADGVIVEEAANRRSDLTTVPGLLAVPVKRLEELPASFGGKDIFEVLGWMPGIQRAGEATGGLLVRGSSPDQNLYLLDGAPIYHPWHAFSLISTFQTETFKDVKFYRGAFPAEYGGRLSAVLDAELRDGASGTPRTVASINPLNARFLIESPIGKNSSFMISGRRSYIDKLVGRRHPVEDAAGRRDTLRTGYFFYDWSAKISFSPDTRSHLSFTYYSGRDQLDLRLPFDLSLDFSSWLRPAELFFEVDQAWGNTLYSARYQYLASDRLFLTGTAYSSEYSAREDTFIRPTRSASVKSDYGVRLIDYGLRVDADFFASLSHQLRGGFQVVGHRFRSTIDAKITYAPQLDDVLSDDGNVKTVEYAAYVQDLWRPGPRIKVLAGSRLSYFQSGNYLNLSPRFSIQYTIDPIWLVLRGAATTQVQYLQRIRDRTSFLYDLVSSRWVPSDDNVIPSRGGQVTIGVESRPLPWLRLTLDGYARGARNVLLPRDEFQTKNGLLGPGIEVGTLLGQYALGRERSEGVEFGAEATRGPLHILLSYTGSRARNRTPDLADQAFRASRFDVPRSFSIVNQYTRNRWQTMLSVIWRTGYPDTVPVSRYALRDPITGDEVFYFSRPEINNGRLPAYFRMDAGVGYTFKFVEAVWNARIQVYNAWGRRNVVSRRYDPADENFSPRNRLGLPLLPLFELEMTL